MGRRCLLTFSAAIWIFLVYFSNPGQASGQVRWKLVRYSNKPGLDRTGEFCDGNNILITRLKTSKCDFYFVVSANGGNRLVWPKFTTKVFQNQDVVDFSEMLNYGIANPRIWRFKRWDGHFNFRIKVWDDDQPTSPPDDVDELVGRISVQPDNIQRQHVIHGVSDQTQFVFNCTVSCDPYYFGDDCSKYRRISSAGLAVAVICAMLGIIIMVVVCYCKRRTIRNCLPTVIIGNNGNAMVNRRPTATVSLYPEKRNKV